MEPFYNERRFSYIAGEAEQGMAVGQFLKERGYSRHALTLLKQTEGGILCNGREVYLSQPLRKGDRMDLFLKEEVPEELPFGIVYEDDDLMVVDKPADMPVHPSMKNHDNTLANAAAWYGRTKGDSFVYRCVNRLDRDTTGLLILAKHILSATGLYGQMRAREIRRTYLAIVKGMIREEGTIDLPVGRKEDSAIERMIDLEHGERAVTHYRPVRHGKDWTLIECRLETGRTHQIRVHMSSFGHPLIGDFLYGSREEQMPRQALHSWKLSFVHPIMGRPMEFVSPLPPDMQKYIGDRS